jgi:hypothetical protein
MDIYLTSTVTSKHPNNTLTNFTCELAKPLHLPTHERWALTIQHISISNIFIPTYRTDIINIQCMDIIPTIDSSFFSTSIGSFTYLPDTSGICYHEFYDRAYFQFRNSDINSISIKLTDLNGNIIKLKDGTITIIKIHIDKMTNNEFHIHCNSQKTTTYPNNKGEYFTVQLPKALNLPGEWEVALTSMTYPPIIQRLFTKPQYIYWINPLKSYVERFKLQKNISTVEELMKNMGDFYEESNRELHFWINRDKKICMVATSYIYFGFSDELIEFFKIRDGSWNSLMKIVKEGYDQNKKHISMDIFAKPEFKQIYHIGKNIIGEPIEVLYRPIQYLWIYTDFVEKTMLGDKMLSILKIIPLTEQSRHDKYARQTTTFNFKEFYKIRNSFLTSLQFQISDVEGKMISYLPKDIIYLTLHFRKSNK